MVGIAPVPDSELPEDRGVGEQVRGLRRCPHRRGAGQAFPGGGEALPAGGAAGAVPGGSGRGGGRGGMAGGPGVLSRVHD